MTKVFILTFKETGTKYAYTSLVAIFLMHAKESLGVSKSKLDKFDFDVSNFENNKVVIEKMLALSTHEARQRMIV